MLPCLGVNVAPNKIHLNNMDSLVGILIFIVILFLYLHIIAQFKTSEDLEIYEFDYTTNKSLQEICELKQPVLFSLADTHPEFFQTVQCEKIGDVADEYDVLVKDVNDYQVENQTVECAALSYRSARLLLKNDTKMKYISENNQAFLAETDLDAFYGDLAATLKPPLTVQTKYDVLMGSRLASTPLKYHTNARTFYAVTGGKIRVKMTPWKSTKYMPYMKDYDAGEFVSPVYVWGGGVHSEENASSPEKATELTLNKKWKPIMDKLKFLEFEVYSGYVLYIPAYWWFSIQYSGDDETTVCEFTYNTGMNRLAHIKDITLYFLQQMNITRKQGGRKTIVDEAEVCKDKDNMKMEGQEKNEKVSKKMEDGADYQESKPGKVDFKPETAHTEIITNTGVYKI